MHAPKLAPQQFQLLAAAMGALSEEEMDRLIAFCDQHADQSALSGGVALAAYRRSSVAWVKAEQGFQWLYERIAKLAGGFNARFFGLELNGIEQALQVARYEAGVRGHYDWHTDFGIAEQTRKLSISVQLSPAEAYEGGDLELDVSTEITRAGRERGLAIAFPSYVRHRVTPVTQGVRYSLVAWVHGPRFR